MSGGGGGEERARQALSWLESSKPRKFALVLGGLWLAGGLAVLVTALRSSPEQPAKGPGRVVSPQEASQLQARLAALAQRQEQLAALAQQQEQLAQAQRQREVRWEQEEAQEAAVRQAETADEP